MKHCLREGLGWGNACNSRYPKSPLTHKYAIASQQSHTQSGIAKHVGETLARVSGIDKYNTGNVHDIQVTQWYRSTILA